MLNDWVERLAPFSRVFHQAGKRVYLVGGALRNRLLGRSVDDFDFATDATPQEVMTMFRRVIPTGLQHGTVTVLLQGEAYEVTTFRIDGIYTDQRRPEQVAFTSDLEQDLGRRDFTINALALDLATGELVDLFGGQDDLQRGMLRAIGDPRLRFQEDALRILRLFRFSSQLGFSIDSTSLEAAVALKESIQRVSRERIRDEWLKLWGAEGAPLAWPLLETHGFLPLLAPQLKASHCPTAVLESWSGLTTLQRVSVWLVACCPGEPWEVFLKELKLSNREVDDVLAPLDLVKELVGPEPVKMRAKRIVSQWGGRERIEAACAVLGALVVSRTVVDAEGLSDALIQLRDSDDPILLRDLAVTGSDLIQAGVVPGRGIGEKLQELQELVWRSPELNVRSVLLERLR